MKKKLAILIVVATLSGCSHYQKFMGKEPVDYSNGINQFEAIMIAGDVIKNTAFSAYYAEIGPTLLDNAATDRYPEYWFVNYSPTFERDFPSYIILINKQTGFVKAGREYWPRAVKNFDWLF